MKKRGKSVKQESVRKTGLERLAAARPARIAFAAALVFFLVRLLWCHYQLISCPIPLEYRETNTPSTTYLFLKGENPFALEHQPQYTNAYGFVFGLVCHPFVTLMGNELWVFRSVSGLFIVLDCLLLLILLRRSGLPWLFSVSGGLILYASLLYFVTPMVRPDSLGLLLYLLAVFIPPERKYSTASLAAGALLCIVAFYTKTYFLLAGIFTGAYLFLFVSKRKGMMYTGMLLIMLGLSVAIVDAVFDTYFSNIFFVYLNYNIDDVQFLLDQLRAYGLHNAGLLAALAVAGFAGRRECRPVRPALHIDGADKPLLSPAMSLPWFLVLAALFLFIYRMGQHKGAWLTYAFQLISPFLILVVMKPFAGLKHLHVPLAVLLIVDLYVASFTFLPNVSSVNRSIKEWKLLTGITAPARSVLNAPMLAHELMKADKEIYDNGSSEYFEHGGQRPGIWGLLFDERPDIRQRFGDFKKDVEEKLRSRKFDMVAMVRGPMYYADEPLVAEYYSLVITIPIHMPHAVMNGKPQRFDIGIWEPKGRERPLEERYKLYKALYECNPNDYHINYYLGFQLFEVLKDYKNAVAFLERAVAVDASNPVVANALGSIYFNHMKDYRNALRHFSRAYALQPGDYSTVRNLGYTYRQIGDEKNAKLYLGRIGEK